MAKNTNYLIAAGIVIVLILLVGLAYMMSNQGNNTATPTPTPTAVPSATATATPTPITAPGGGSTSAGNSTATVTATPTATATVTPTVTATATPTVTPTATAKPSSTVTPTVDPYKVPWWPLYNKQWGTGVSEIKKGTIRAYVGEPEYPFEGVDVGVVSGSYGNDNGFDAKMTFLLFVKVELPPLPDTWKQTGSDGYVDLGEFNYGSYTVIYHNNHFYEWKTVTVDDNNRNALVVFDDIPG